ncbi:hypothetical protein EON64_04005 [archaeon]|nr:MAG: hypothetical protein EON64_04005 [archaeon]
MSETIKSTESNKKFKEGEGELKKFKSEPIRSSNKAKSNTDFANDAAVIKRLKTIYREKLLPVEKQYLFHKFNQPEILDSELSAKATVLLIGQYSTGKTSFIRTLIGTDYPEMHIGPEPTTDRFIAVVHGEETKTIKGNALTGVSDLPFSGLSVFGTSFLNKFSAAVVNAPLLQDLTIIDTPGVLSGEKQRTARGYDFAKVSRWFAERSDLILLLFDCSKLDISDEFKGVIEELQPFEDKVHCVLNKADVLDSEALLRVYGALLWSMGRIFKGAEVTRIYVGSFGGDEMVVREEHKTLFAKDRAVLMSHLQTLPRACAMRKVNDMVRRVRLNVVHACILGYLKAQMPWLWGKEHKQAALLKDLDKIFLEVRTLYQLAEGDLPKVDDYRAVLALSDLSTFPKVDRKVLNGLQDVLLSDIPELTEIVAGVSSSKFNRQSQEEGGSQQPTMFTIDEALHSRQNRISLPIGYLLLALVVVGLATWSHLDQHVHVRHALKVLAQLLESLSNVTTTS